MIAFFFFSRGVYSGERKKEIRKKRESYEDAIFYTLVTLATGRELGQNHFPLKSRIRVTREVPFT